MQLPVSEQIQEIQMLGKFHQEPILIIKLLQRKEQLKTKDLYNIILKIQQLLYPSMLYLSLLSIGQRHIFEYLIRVQSEVEKSLTLKILLSLLMSQQAIDYFVCQFTDSVDLFITHAVTKIEIKHKFDKFETSIGPRFASIFKSQIKIPALNTNFIITYLSAQIIMIMVNNKQARIIIQKRAIELIQVLKESQLVEILIPYRLHAISNILYNLAIKFEFDASKFNLQVVRTTPNSTFWHQGVQN